jgi:SPP1 gp7 family putative phage head morphogenesis protein
MAIKDYFVKKEVKEIYSPAYFINDAIVNVAEQFKGEVVKKNIKFPSELGEEHPFNFEELEKLYMKFGLFTAAVDKYIDFIVGPGFYVECDDERAKKIIEDFMRDVNFDTLLRAWAKEALIKGNGFLEIGGSKNEGIKGLKVLNANWMYVVRDKKGKIEGYNQYKGGFDLFAKQKVIPFKDYEIAHVPFNKVGDMAYGLGIGYPLLKIINDLLQNQKDQQVLTNRKANSPIHAKIGKVEGDIKIIPKREDVIAFGKELENLHSKHEFSTDPLVDMKVLDFGNIGEKFVDVLKHDLDMFIYAIQIPAVILGQSNIPEGLAKVQMDGFQRRIQSIQAELEKIIEENIFKRVLESNGFKDIHVEFEWGEPSSMAVEGKINLISELIKSPTVSIVLKDMLEKELVNMLKLDVDEYEKLKNEEEELQRELERPQPIVPGTNANFPQKPVPKNERPTQPKPEEIFKKKIIEKKSTKSKTFNEGWKRNYEFINRCKKCNEGFDNYNTIEEWLGFKYSKFLAFIKNAIVNEDFEQLRAVNEIELQAGYLSGAQIVALRQVLDEGITNGLSINEISKNLANKAKIKDLYRLTDEGKIMFGASGLPILQATSEKRVVNITRTELSRVANKGAVDYYKDRGIQEIKHVAAISDRTCPECNDLDNTIYKIGEEPGLPVHPLCRCTYSPVVELS